MRVRTVNDVLTINVPAPIAAAATAVAAARGTTLDQLVLAYLSDVAASRPSLSPRVAELRGILAGTDADSATAKVERAARYR